MGGSLQNDDDKRTCGELLLFLFLLTARTNAKNKSAIRKTVITIGFRYQYLNFEPCQICSRNAQDRFPSEKSQESRNPRGLETKKNSHLDLVLP